MGGPTDNPRSSGRLYRPSVNTANLFNRHAMVKSTIGMSDEMTVEYDIRSITLHLPAAKEANGSVTASGDGL